MKLLSKGIFVAAGVLMLVSSAAIAGEAVKGSNLMVMEGQNWKTSDKSGYWTMKAEGVSEYTVGPFETSAVECHGAGFWDAEGSWGEGICIHGAGEDTRTSTWKIEKGAETGRWVMTGGTGKYAGIAGEGTYKPTRLPGGRAVSRFEGTVTLAQ